MKQGDDLSNAIGRWSIELLGCISNSLQAHREVVIIALSRKMPRVLGLIKKIFLSSDDTLVSMLNRCVVTTEHAIPLVLSKEANQAVIILDDIINTGETLQTVVDDVNLFSGCQPYIISLYKANEARKIERAIIRSYGIETTRESLKESFEVISHLILEKGLPIDMEYPILYLEATMKAGTALFPVLSSRLASAYPKSIQYDISHGEVSNHVLILEEETNKLYNNDFSKLRFYRDGEAMKVASISPNVLSEYNLRQEDMFVNPKYNRLWKRVWSLIYRKEIDRETQHDCSPRIYRTLIIWANYLYSLSSFVRNRNNFAQEYSNQFQVELEDLSFILGEKLAKELLPEINAIVREGEVSPSTREYLRVPACLVDERIFKSYTLKKYMIVMKDYGIESQLYKIFKIAGELSRTYHVGELETRMPIEESFASLIESFRIRYKDLSEISQNIYQWIDETIDKGLIVPRYERVMDESGNAYWKRYFRFSSLALDMEQT
jgi:hypothetical protein